MQKRQQGSAKHRLRNVGHTGLEVAAARSSSASSNSTERSSAAWMLVSVPAHGDFWLCNSARCATQQTRDSKISIALASTRHCVEQQSPTCDWALSRAQATDVCRQKREGGWMAPPVLATDRRIRDIVCRARRTWTQQPRPRSHHSCRHPRGQRQRMRIGDADNRLCHSVFDIGTSFMHSDELATHILLPYPRRSRAPFVRSCGLSQSILILNQLDTP